jgi:hypothetical protein
MVVAISPAKPPVTGASCEMITRPVLAAEASTVSWSQGSSVRRSISSQEMPSFSASSQACAVGGEGMH